MLFKSMLAVCFLASSVAQAAPSQDQLVAMLKVIDDRSGADNDYKSLALIEQKTKGKDDLIYEAVIYRRDASDQLMILFLRPKAEAGKGYLRIDKNLFMYDPTVGKWERRTERERIAGTNSRRQDFDERRLAEEFVPKFVADEKLGKFAVTHVELKAKPTSDVAYPVIQLWIDNDSGNMLKQQEFALSGRLMRTSYYPKWGKVRDPKSGKDVYYPMEIRMYDEVEKGTDTTIVLREVDLTELPANMFTKAWLESKSR